ncbi:hypothetical protein DLN05_23280 [Salmonella enterica subsp. enterica serovar Newport str. CFSAN000834]|uniref:Uncharacterized protein n=1 Tax=Salmonella enterica subsp. enterica serovar Newport str. CFSAN000835 TaxID=1299174 RepID=A0A658IDE5_SALNE|nr:hypothetical protein DLN05_23280 [Salmonella enterica subsp. enterica serovar Newport str. CFSAN000834]RIQ23766.1 hypothetical protein DLN06_23220 [Salmonella enterica subsp. enterica serovar Newport str. CFSAN000835]
MRNNRYVHYVARFGSQYISGVVDVSPQTTPLEVHEGIQFFVCNQLGLNELHKKDIVVEKMRPLE